MTSHICPSCGVRSEYEGCWDEIEFPEAVPTSIDGGPMPEADQSDQVPELGGSVGRSASRACRHANHSVCTEYDPTGEGCQCRCHGGVIGDTGGTFTYGLVKRPASDEPVVFPSEPDPQHQVGIGESDYEGPVVDFQDAGPEMTIAELGDGAAAYARWVMSRGQVKAAADASWNASLDSPYKQQVQQEADRSHELQATQQQVQSLEFRLAATKDALKECLKAQVAAQEEHFKVLNLERRELIATQKAKRENDERFQLEANRQRERADALALALEESRRNAGKVVLELEDRLMKRLLDAWDQKSAK